VTVRVLLAETLRPHADGAKHVELDVGDGATVLEVLDALAEVHPSVGRRVRDETGVQRRHVNVFVGTTSVTSTSSRPSFPPVSRSRSSPPFPADELGSTL
jgi:hypothetical protein